MSVCPACATVFTCAMADRPEPAFGEAGSAEARCWCGAIPVRMPLPPPGAAHASCYCPACLTRLAAARAAAAN